MKRLHTCTHADTHPPTNLPTHVALLCGHRSLPCEKETCSIISWYRTLLPAIRSTSQVWLLSGSRLKFATLFTLSTGPE